MMPLSSTVNVMSGFVPAPAVPLSVIGPPVESPARQKLIGLVMVSACADCISTIQPGMASPLPPLLSNNFLLVVE